MKEVSETENLATGLLALQHVIEKYKVNLAHLEMRVKTRIDRGINAERLITEVEAEKVNIEAMSAVYRAAGKELYRLTSKTEVSLAE